MPTISVTRQSLLPTTRGIAAGRRAVKSAFVQNVIGSLDVLGHVHVRNIERVAVLIKAVSRSVGNSTR
jgi:hypothetical protein